MMPYIFYLYKFKSKIPGRIAIIQAMIAKFKQLAEPLVFF